MTSGALYRAGPGRRFIYTQTYNDPRRATTT